MVAEADEVLQLALLREILMNQDLPLLPVTEAKFPYFFGVDVGGTNIKIGLVDDLGRTIAYASIPTDEPAGPQAAMERTRSACQALMRETGARPQDIPRIGLGTPGPMDLAKGMLLGPTNLPHWHHFPIRDALAEAMCTPVSFVNDANAATFGEFWVGTGEKYASLVMFTLGTGVGGGLITEGSLINGLNSFGSELGHYIVDSRPDARLCVWGGGRGQLEAYSSASAVSARAAEGVAAGKSQVLASFVTDPEELTAKHVHEAALLDDPFSLELIDETAFYLGIGTVNAVHAIDPGLVVLGGAMDFGGSQCRIGQRFLERITQVFEERTFPNVAAGTKIQFASLGAAAGHIGAAGIAHQDFHKIQHSKL